jgi:3-hydroxyisobutyrate dehydrogenase-like beta-hydroxyacid dehydrogenase
MEHFRRKKMERVGLIGLGNMGTGMAKNLVKNGFRLMVYDIRDEALREMADLGAGIADSPQQSESVINIRRSMLGVRCSTFKA